MNFEHTKLLFENYDDGHILRPKGENMVLSFCCDLKKDKRYRLFVVGETTQFYQWKNEPDGPMQYRTVCDALDAKHARQDRYCLNLSSHQPETYIRRVYKKVMFPPMLSYLRMAPVSELWQAGAWATAENLHIKKDGFLRMRIDIRYKHDGVDLHSVALEPDETYTIDLPNGTWEWRKFLCEIKLYPENIAHVGVWIEGKNYSGNVYVEHPFLQALSDWNLLPQFDMPVTDKNQFDWTAQNLSRKEWPEFEVCLNGEQIFCGAVFERPHRCSEWEIDVPSAMLKTKNELQIRLVSDYHDPLPYKIHEIRLLEHPCGAVALIAASQIASVQEGAYVLIRTAQNNTPVLFAAHSDALVGETEYVFDKAGLHGIHLKCLHPAVNASFTLNCNGVTVSGCVERIAERQPDGVITGTGDMVYIEQRMDCVEEFLCWYAANHIGNLLTIRPVYRWSGSKTLVPEIWAEVGRVLNELDIHYVLMQDGRELPGINANPDDKMLRGNGYCGRQLHERDGAAWYWGNSVVSESLMNEQFYDMAQTVFKEDPEHTAVGYAPENFVYVNGKTYLYRNPLMKQDNRVGYAEIVKFLKNTRFGTLRHTGPSLMFKYLYDVGFQWLGAETMYGSMELQMAFLRGASAMNKRTTWGVHHAMQWSSTPHNVPEHYRRFYLALYVSYMQGATEINTEEGLWHMEEHYSHFHRFSDGCQGHLQQQQKFYRYVASHSRTGTFYTPMALLQGRYDGWHAFGNQNPWGWQGTSNSDAEKSWDLLKVFYPLSKPGDTLYFHGCATNRAVGYYTGIPMANVDVIPAESGAELFKRYKALAFMGYHCACAEDKEKLAEYIKSGGKLLLTRAHLTDTTDFNDILNYQIKECSDFCAGLPRYVENHVQGKAVKVCSNVTAIDRIFLWTDEGIPLVCEYNFGLGKVILVNTLAYPAHPAIRSVYEACLEKMMKNALATEKVWCEAGEDVGTAVYKQDDGSIHIYLLAVDWYRPEEKIRNAVIRIKQHRYTVQFPFGVMTKCVVAEECAAWPHTEDGEVLSICNKSARVQGTGKVKFEFAKNGTKKTVTVDFSDNVIQDIFF